MMENQHNDPTTTTWGTQAPPLIILLILVAIMVMGAGFRYLGMDWDEGFLLHPDERFLAWVTADMSVPESFGAFLDTTTSTMNPNNVGHGFYVYGTLPVFIGRVVGELVDKTSLYSVYLPGRYLSATFDVLSILMVFFVGRAFFDDRIGLFASAFYASAGLPIQLSHFYAVDTFAAFFVLASLWMLARILRRHRWIDFALFGLTMGAAMGSKISTFPLALFIVVAVALRVAGTYGFMQPTYPEHQLPERDLKQDIIFGVLGIGIAALMTVITFRLAQPYAFLPAGSPVPIDETEIGGPMALASRVLNPLGLRPNPSWLDQMKEVGRQVSGEVDFPPNHQWAHRTALLWPLWNMGKVGMGWPLMIAAWLAVLWTLWEIWKGHPGANRLIILSTWVLLFFLWQGTAWVKALRYFLPIYGAIFIIAAWGLLTLWDRTAALIKRRGARSWSWPALVSSGLGVTVLLSSGLWGFAVSRIYSRPVTRIEASHWIVDNLYSDITLDIAGDNGIETVQAALYNNWTWPQTASEDQNTHPAASYTLVTSDSAQNADFLVTDGGTLQTLRVNHIASITPDTQDQSTLRISLYPAGATAPIYSGEVTGNFPLIDDERGASCSFDLDQPVILESGQRYRITLQVVEGNPVTISGARIAHEGDWDDAIPYSVDELPIWNVRYNHYELQMAWEDTPAKRERLEYILNHTDYIFISSNRFYDSMSRLPERFPMTIAYYEALFNGELGFELVADFTSRPNLGPIRFNDDEAEETWTVYDHPRVLIFRKTEDYSADTVAAILDAVDIEHTVVVTAKHSQGPPVDIDPPDGPVIGRSYGSINRATADYDPVRTDLYSRVQPLAVLIWWGLLTLLGWSILPLLYSLLPMLSDRGYPIARTLGLFLTAWLGWLTASLTPIQWSGGLLWALMALLALSGAALIWRRRTEFITWLSSQRRDILRTETLLGVLFLAFVLIRLGNPDLWHPYFGGEKPMDFSYLNAVINTTSFPPYDPWFAGGSINYYYFGFVMTAAPIKMLGMPPTLGYNLAVPTFFALTGGAAYSTVWNLIRGSAELAAADTHGSQLSSVLKDWPSISLSATLDAADIDIQRMKTRMGHRPWIPAGIAAVLLTIVLGNLGTIRTPIWALAELGEHRTLWWTEALPRLDAVVDGLAEKRNGQVLPIGIGEWYWNPTRIVPVPVVNDQATEVGPITEFPFFTFLYADLHAHMMAMPLTLSLLLWGVAQIKDEATDRAGWLRRIGMLVLGGLLIGALRPTNTWDWPTYLGLSVVIVGLAESHRRRDRNGLMSLVSGALGAALLGTGTYLLLTAEMPAPDNLMMTLAMAAGVGFVVFFGITASLSGILDRSTPPENRSSITPWVTLGLVGVQAALIFLIGRLAFAPYYANYSLAYTSFLPWDGSHTPMWAYLFIHGLFLFLILSWYVTESIHWWHTRQAAGRQTRQVVIPLLLISGVALGAGILVGRSYPIAALVIPMLAWSAALFLTRDLLIEKRLVISLILLGLVLSIAVDLIVIQGDIGRMNTVFKFYLQVWMLFAIGGAAAFGWLIPEISRLKWRAPRAAWSVSLSILVILAGLYPLLATRAKIMDRWNPNAPVTLDGMAYMPTVTRSENGATFSLQADYEALRWMQDTITGTPVVLEGHTTEYRWGNRVAVYTGLPSVIGWNNHQRQQRAENSYLVDQRATQVDQAYTTTDINEVLAFLDEYDVQLLIVGDLEQALYPAEGLQKFEDMVESGYLQVVYDRLGTRIYQVISEEPTP